MSRFLLLAAVALTAAPAAAQEYVWIEGEAVAVPPAGFSVGGWGRADVLSGGKWLFAAVEPADVAKKFPADGARIATQFEITDAGPREVWGRIGYEFARAPFRWRIDAGEWAEVKPDDYTTDLMALADFAEVAWKKLGSVQLKAGKHTLEIAIPRPTKTVNGKAEPQRLLFGLDAVCLSRGAFHPNGPHRPGADWQTPLDRAAGKVTFEFPAAVAADPAARRELTLGGTWQIARFDEPGEVEDRTGPIRELPDLDTLHWKAIRVPGDKDAERPEWAYCHRYLLRTRIKVPAELAGRSFVLRFPNTALLTTVFVNGTRVGFGDTPCAPFECDATAAVRPGQVNELVVGVKDLYYAIAKTGDGKSCRHLFNYPHDRFHNGGGLPPTRFADFPVLFKVRRNGVLETPSLVACGPAYTADVFCVPSVKNKTLGLEVTVHNPGDKPVAVELRAAVRQIVGGPPVKTFAPAPLTVPAGQSKTVKLSEPWADPVLWWPDAPHQYLAETTLVLDGKPADRLDTKFGFREWGWRGTMFTLNGVPWQLRADLRHNGRESGQKDPEAAVAEWRRNGQNTFRLWGDIPWAGDSQRETLDFFDAHGVIVRRSGTFDGEVGSYQLAENGKPHRALFDNWRRQLAAWVRAERNHPSVLVWSLENEITYINARNFGMLDAVEPEVRKAADAVMALDPTRPAMIDGGDALRDQSLPVYGNHYLEEDKRDYPDEAYSLSRAYAPRGKGAWNPWPIARDKPLFLGESFFANGSPPAAYAEVDGEAAFLGRREAARGVSRFARMLSEGYRWHGVAAFHFWFAEGADAEHYRAWQPVCVLAREWNSAVPAGERVTRTLKAFNDTRHADPVTVHWLFQTRGPGAAAVRGKKTLALPPGGAEEFSLNLDVPPLPANARQDAELVLTCERNGKEVFRDVKPYRVFGPAAAAADAAAGEVAVWDPTGKAADLLRGVTPFTPVDDPDKLPAKCKLLVVGPDAVTPRLATDPRWTALAAKGLRVLVLDQTHPLHYQAVPADLEPTAFAGRIAFPENPTHPAFDQLGRADFFCWSGDHVVYRNAYRKPGRGARSLVQCDKELSCSALVECPVGDGLLVLSQLAAGAKPGDPVARRVTANLVRYAWTYKRQAKPTAVVMSDADPRAKLLAAAGLKFDRATDPVAVLDKAEVAVVDATPANLKALAAAADRVRAFADRGGWLVLWGVTPAGLADFNRLVGFDHAIRPFKRERVTLAPARDPLAAGLTLRDVALESAEKIYPWAGDRYPADDTFTHVVDLDDVAPFVKSDKFAHGWAQMTNGLTSADSWKFIFYHDQKSAGDRPSWAGRLPKPEEITGLSVVVNAHYRRIIKLRVVFDGDRDTAVTLDLKPEAELRQDFPLSPRKCREIALEPVEWTDHANPTIGVDNLWLRVLRPADFGEKVVPLLNIGALAKYPVGKGGILLNQVRVSDAESNPENAARKQALVATFLRNLGAEFAAERLLVPGANLAYHPAPLGQKCNLYLSADKEFPGGKPDLANFPVGDQRFAGVRYEVRDFRTSPLPAAVAVTGPGEATKLPARVTGLTVGRRADVLFFLHTLQQTRPWQPPRNPKSPAEPPEVFRYVVRYADGRTADVPVRLGRQVGPCFADAARGLPNAAVAWTAPADGGKQAVVYQFSWTNPRPGVAVESVELAAPEKPGDRYGVPVLLGLTAATEIK